MTVSKPIAVPVASASAAVSGLKARVPRNIRKSKAKPAELPLPLSCLEQAEICREQAREAARLKRFKAALGLFSTAAALCRRAGAVQDVDEGTRTIASDRLRQIDMEMATYSELLRSMERPTGRV